MPFGRSKRPEAVADGAVRHSDGAWCLLVIWSPRSGSVGRGWSVPCRRRKEPDFFQKVMKLTFLALIQDGHGRFEVRRVAGERGLHH